MKRLENDFGMKNSSFNVREQLFPFQTNYLVADYNAQKSMGLKTLTRIQFTH